MNGLDAFWRLPIDLELWLILAYVVGVVIGARIVEAVAKMHFAAAHRNAEQGFEYVEPHNHYQCLGGARLTLLQVHEPERLAIYQAPASNCGGCQLKERCTPHAESRTIYRSLATWAETDVGRFHQFVSLLMFVVAAVLSLVGIWRWMGQPGFGLLLLGFVGSITCLALQSRRLASTVSN